MIKFLSDELWTTIKLLAKKSKKTKVAVPYFGNGGARRLQMKKNDTLLVSLTLFNVKNGLINPFEIEKLYKRGVLIFNLQNLHSKIYKFDDKVIVCSANVSTFSENTLIETGILTNDKKIVSLVEKFFTYYCIEKVDKSYIEICKKYYRPILKKVKKGTNKIKPQFSRVWVISTETVEINDKISRKKENLLKNKITNKNLFTIYKITYPPSDRFINRVVEGDLVIEIFTDEDSKVIVYEPKRVLGVTFNTTRNRKVLVLERPKNQKSMSWVNFEKKLRKDKIKFITEYSTKEIKNEIDKRILLSYFI